MLNPPPAREGRILPALTVGPLTPATLFARETLWQSWLDVEAALARAQARIGMIPEDAASAITEAARVETLGAEAIAADAARTLAPILSLTRLLAEAAGPAGAWVHWGATTQNVMQTGRILLMREAHAAIGEALAGALDTMATTAETHAETMMAGRTNRRHALPITYGFKVAGFIEETGRAAHRLADAAGRLWQLPFGGAVGAMHAFGPEGRALNAALASDLGLAEMLVPGRTVNDLFTEYVLALAMLAMSVERIAGELYRLMAEEFGEIAERQDAGVVGSSTMPQKVNPKHVVRVLAEAAELRALAAPALEAGLSKHEGDSVANHLLTTVLDRAVPLAWRLADGFADVLVRCVPQPGRMAHNLALTDGGIAAEAIMMRLASTTGRAAAHDLVHHALEHGAAHGLAPRAALLADAAIRAHLDPAAIEVALDPARYAGDSAAIARDGANLARTLAAELRADGF